MLNLKIGNIKKTFFDKKAVAGSVDKASSRVLPKFGAFVRRAARSLIRKAKRVSEPGQPPKGKTGVLRDFLFFAYDGSEDRVFIGPAKTNQVFFQGDGKPVTGTVPSILEAGGRISILEVFKWGKWRRADLRSRRHNAGLPTRLRTIQIEPRPFMGPALAKEQPKLPALWANSVKG